MTKPFHLSVVILLCAFNAASQPCSKPARSKTTTLVELVRVTHEIYDAGIGRDRRAIEKYLGNLYLETDAFGNLRDKEWNLQNFGPKDQKVNYKIEDVRVRDYGNAAILYYQLLTELGTNEPRTKVKLRVTDIFVRKHCRWQLVASHRTRFTNSENAAK